MEIRGVKPLFDGVITTMHRYSVIEEDGIIEETREEGSLMEIQEVVSVGEYVRCVKKGDMVKINPSRYAVRKHQDGSLKDGILTDNVVTHYNFHIVLIGGVEHLFLKESDLEYIVECE